MSTTLIHDATPILAGAGSMECRRASRQPLCVFVTALVQQESQFRIHSCRMSVVSATGARISSSAPLGPGELYLLILMDGLRGKLIRAEFVHEQVDASIRVPERRRSARYHYGVQFLAFVSDPELVELLQCALPDDLAQVHGCR
jgi:hypothetical protein